MEKQKFDRDAALAVAKDLYETLRGSCERIVFAGSLRRRKKRVGDIEVLFIPKMVEERLDMFDTKQVSLVDIDIAAMEASGVLERRKNSNGSEMFGPKNKFMRHRKSGIPVDLFTASVANWHNYLVCRTGPAELNTKICMLAQDRGWKWNPYGSGFSRGGTLAGETEERQMNSEQEVFEFVGLKYLEPWDRA